jgi:hypothetical protein
LKATFDDTFDFKTEKIQGFYTKEELQSLYWKTFAS